MEDPETTVDVSEELTRGVIDESMLGMGEFISQMTEVEGYLRDDEMGTATRLERVAMEFPIQLDVHVSEDGSVVIGGSPPLYYVETTVAPVFHQFRIDITVEENTKTDARTNEQGMES
jgi:hypothetical protein